MDIQPIAPVMAPVKKRRIINITQSGDVCGRSFGLQFPQDHIESRSQNIGYFRSACIHNRMPYRHEKMADVF